MPSNILFMKKFFLLFAFVAFFIGVFAQIPAGYYQNAEGKTGEQLRLALHNIIKDHNAQSYSSLIGYFESTDKKTNNTVWDMYSDVPGGTPPYVYHFNSGDECGNYGGEGDCYNREHSFPKSWFNDATPMYTDLFHIYPTDGYVNGKRSNYPYGKVGNASWTSQNGSKLGNCMVTGYSGVVFEPIDEYKGDLARTYFYMATRYYTEDGGWAGSEMVTGCLPKPWALAMLRQWATQDPVSPKEIDRNNAIYQIQNNRNPFIDHPEYAEAIWGTSAGITNPEAVSVSVYPNPVQDYCTVTLSNSLPANDEVITFSNMAGQRINIPVTFQDHSLVLNTQALPKGIYLLQLHSSDFSVNLQTKILK